MTRARITYCGNVHPAEDLDSFLATLDEFAAVIRDGARRQRRSFGLGAWWNAAIAGQLAVEGPARARVRWALDRLGLELWTLNVFPFGGFHDEVVKTAVYAPDWATKERLRYTLHAAEAAAALVARDTVMPLSTLPLGYRGPGDAPADLRVMARNLARAASALATVETRTGVCCVLALEPEPCCLLETCAGAAGFLERWLFEEGAWSTVPVDVLRRHLGVCVDLCHLAVVGEDPLAALTDLRARGIAVPKIQVSACLELRDIGALDRLLAFDEPRYLHQTVGRGVRALDLGEVARRREEFRGAAPVRTHFHVPVWWDEDGPLGSTRGQVQRVLKGLVDPLPLLEVETYTWSVLGDFGCDAPLTERIGRELDFTARALGGGPGHRR